MRCWLAIGGAAIALGLAGCGGDSTGEDAGVTITPGSSVVAKSDGSHDNAPAITKALVQEWPSRWCSIKIGVSREAVVRAMGAYPTEENSHKIPLIPPIDLNASGENRTEAPPEPAGSDTWEAPGSYQFNAFYDTSLHVQQLDFNGPTKRLPCKEIRV